MLSPKKKKKTLLNHHALHRYLFRSCWIPASPGLSALSQADASPLPGSESSRGRQVPRHVTLGLQATLQEGRAREVALRPEKELVAADGEAPGEAAAVRERAVPGCGRRGRRGGGGGGRSRGSW
eukprot:768819-Hanusia_phi.AAC.4